MDYADTATPGRAEPAGRAISGAQWSISADGHEAVLVEVGGGLRSYSVNGVDYVDGFGEDEVCPGGAGQILAPWPNRIRDGQFTFAGEQRQLALTEAPRHNAIHGLVNWLPWRCVEQQPAAVTLECDLPAQPGYPWPLLLRTRWSVGADGLRVAHEVVNTGAQECPFGLSVHPYLVLPGVSVDDIVLHVPARTRLLVDSRLLPIGAAKVAGTEYDFTTPRRIGPAVLDTAFGDVEQDANGRSAVTLSTADGSASVALWADSAFGWWQIYTGDTLPAPRLRRSIAVEPMTCPPDAFRSGRDVIVLRPGEAWLGTWGIVPNA